MSRLVICHLYPDLMSIYGDRGNVIALAQRATWRGVGVEIRKHTIGAEADLTDVDLFFFGGGQDRQQIAVSRHLQGPTRAALEVAKNNGAAFLSICGGYQLLGHYFRTGDGDDLPGIGLLDASTVAGPRRFIGDVIVACDEDALRTVSGLPPCLGDAARTLVGFENHSGLTTLGPGAVPLGRMQVGCGNDGVDGSEGGVSGTCYGSYLHGSLLPKNPWLTDLLLECALRHRLGRVVQLEPLDDDLETAAHDAVAARIRRRGRIKSAIKR